MNEFQSLHFLFVTYFSISIIWILNLFIVSIKFICFLVFNLFVSYLYFIHLFINSL